MALNTQGRLISRFTENLPAGRLEWIGLRTERRGRIEVVEQTEAIAELGLDGDRRCQSSSGSARQVTIISREYLGQIAHFLGRDTIDPVLVRRNLVVSGINLSALRHQRFCIGTAEFEAGAICHPCSRMEEALRPGAVAAMLGHGGVCARVIKSGQVRVGDAVLKI